MATRLNAGKLKKLLRTNPKIGELWATCTALQTAAGTDSAGLNDRARIILAASILDQLLRFLILAHFPEIDDEDMAQVNDLFEGDSAPLGSFSSRIKIGFALGIFGPKTKQDLERIKAIRNACAHSRVAVHFEAPEVAGECERFNALKIIKWGGFHGPEPTTAEGKFLATINHYFMCLSWSEDETPKVRYRFADLGKLFS
jgi:hypothetical protein